mgnify:CR=1 FL=1
MSFLSKLSKLKRDTSEINGKPSHIAHTQKNKNSHIEDETSSLLPKNYIRDEDPAVRRLKEIRNKERLKSQSSEKPKRTPSKPRTVTKRKSKNDMEQDIGTVYKRRLGSNNRNNNNNNMITKRREPIKKMSFDELMKQADSQTRPSPSPRSIASNTNKSIHLNKPGFKKRNPIRDRKVVSSLKKKDSNMTTQEQPQMVHLNTRMSTSIARPHARFEAKLNKRRNRYEEDEDEYDEDLDDFIEDDEEEEESAQLRDRGYDRNEIWAMFNRRGHSNHPRPDEEWESDDMETNEIDIMAEEEEASKAARLEDKREQNWLRKHDEAKARVKARNHSKG